MNVTSTLYSPVLAADEIRLLTVTGKDAGRIQCHMERVSRHVADYDALSYTWGHPDRTADVVCNGTTVKIPPPLLIALDHLSNHRSGRPIWIDAICLNQDDLSEKESQVPLMFEVYTHARNVIIWLGPGDESSDDVFDRIPQFQSELSSFRQCGQYGYPHPEDHFWTDLGGVLHRPWFERLWTLQETVLGKEKWIMCGDKHIEWTKFNSFLDLTSDGGCRQKINSKSIRDPFRVNAFVSMAHSNTIQTLKTTQSQGAYILAVLNLARFRQCLKDVDHVYAILGLLPQTTRLDIKDRRLVDYNLDAAELFVEVARNYLLTSDLGLQLLSMAKSVNKRASLPSWCPDWALNPSYGRFLSQIPSYQAGICPGDHVLIAGNLHNQVYAHGFQIDTVNRVSLPWHPAGGDGQVTSQEEDYLKRWEDSCRDIMMETLSGSEFPGPYIRTMIGNTTGAHPVVCTQDFKKEYEDFRHLNHCPEEPCPHTHLNNAKYLRFCESLGQNCTGRAFFSTVEGRIGMGPFDMERGDVVCILFGGKPLYVLRELSGNTIGEDREKAYILVGDAYVDGLMDGQAFRCDQRGADKKFCLV